MEQRNEEGNEMEALFKVWLQVLISLIYAYYFVSKLSIGKLRFFALIPIFYLFTILPLSLSSPTACGLSGFYFTWLANFKLILFCFDLGPLSSSNSIYKVPAASSNTWLVKLKAFLNFVLVASFPIKIQQSVKNDQTTLKHKKEPMTLKTKFFLYILLVISGVYFNYHQNVNPNVLMGIYSGVIYLNLEVIMGFYNKILGSLLDVELSPPFDEPYLSTSLQDFWGRRWNLVVSDIIRQTIYTPTRAFWEFHIGKMWAQCIAAVASFLVSGLMHELLFYYITRVSPTWEVTCFFLLHGLCLVVEMGLKRSLGLGNGWAIHWAISGPLTIGFVIWTGFWLFFPQLVRNQVDVRSLDEVKVVGKFFESVLKLNVTRVLGT